MNNFIFRILLGIIPILLSVSCVKDTTEIGGVSIPEGDSQVYLDIEFRPLEDPLTTRTAGDKIKRIDDINILFYKVADDGTSTLSQHLFLNSSGFTTAEVVPGTTSTQTNAEAKTCKATVNDPIKLSYGKYRIYAVANMGDMRHTSAVASESTLREIQLNWSTTIANNDQMFGVFTTSSSIADAPSYEDVFGKLSVNNITYNPNVYTLTITQPNLNLHAWVRRAASKVTIAYDGTNLNENVYIYIHSVQIKDVPKQAYLGKRSKATNTNQLIEGETINYRGNSSADLAGITITKGSPTGGSNHSETADALFFYENMQGKTTNPKGKHQDENDENKVTNPNGNNPADADYKDGIPYGTYIEVKGYYVNKNQGSASQGDITYRFMLGKNITNDCNAERNNHYKVTLKFKHDANNPDWHIVYDVEKPTLEVANPLYISYLHGEKLDIPVVIRGGKVTSFKATIVDNDWEYEGHPYININKNSGESFNYNGFLTFKDTTNPNNPNEVEAAEREEDFNANSSRSNFTGTSVNGTNETHYNVPVYTREVYLGHGFSGNNSYLHKTRSAHVKFEAIVEIDGKTQTFEETIEVIQVKRVINPAGVWRPHNSTADFRVTLMELNEESASDNAFEAGNKDYEPTLSDGPWTASIIQGEDWVQIKSLNGSWGTADVTGSTGSKIDFYYKPNSTIAADQTRCGVIKITYHNNTCVHYVFVSQGDAPVTMGTGSKATRWHTKNVKYKGNEVDNPVHEGSLFRFHNSEYAIIPENNYRTGFGPFENGVTNIGRSVNKNVWVLNSSGTLQKDKKWPLADGDNNNYIGARESQYTLRINYNKDYSHYNNASKGKEFEGIMGSNAQVASVEQWNELKKMKRYYGVLYGEYARETKTKPTDMYEYPFDGSGNAVSNSQKGMRGMFVWDRDGSKGHIFLPLGSKGHGHRAQFPDWNATSNVTPYYNVATLKYSNMSEPMDRPQNDHRPLLIDLYMAWGAIYWCSNWDSANGDDDYSASGGSVVAQTGGQNAMDINFNTYDFNTYMEHATWRNKGRNRGHDDITQSSDACFIRCVEK